MNLLSSGVGDMWGDEAGDSDAEARVNAEEVGDGVAEDERHRLDKQIEAAERRNVENERRRRERHREEQLQHFCLFFFLI